MAINLGNGCFYIERGPVALFRFSGPDHLRYLHNRLTQDVKSLPVGGGARSLCLSPNGRIQAELLILKDENSIDILTAELPSKEFFPEIKNAIMQFKVADQVECSELSDRISQITLVGSGLKSLAMVLGVQLGERPRFSHFIKDFDEAPLRIMISLILGLEALEIVGSTDAIGQLKTMSSMFGVQELDASSVELLRILDRRWKYTVDVDDKTLAAEVNLQELVSFKKGCYPGQEVVEMSVSRGRPNRSLELLTSDTEVPVGSDVKVGEKSVGSVTSSIYLADEPRAFFLTKLKTDFLSSTELTVSEKPCRIVTKEESISRIA